MKDFFMLIRKST